MITSKKPKKRCTLYEHSRSNENIVHIIIRNLRIKTWAGLPDSYLWFPSITPGKYVDGTLNWDWFSLVFTSYTNSNLLCWYKDYEYYLNWQGWTEVFMPQDIFSVYVFRLTGAWHDSNLLRVFEKKWSVQILAQLESKEIRNKCMINWCGRQEVLIWQSGDT